MDYEKAYKEALARARALNEGKTTGAFGETVCEYIFPELKESEDEKIRKTLIEIFSKIGKKDWRDIPTEKIIAWLEKQGKQNPADKVVQKFKVGDWVATSYGKVNQVIAVDDDGDGFTLDDDTYFSGSWKDGYHLWTIADAKDGDVIACNEEILLFKLYSVPGRISLYCWYNGKLNSFHSKGVDDIAITTTNKIYPATKEQRDTLMKAMADAGWEFDFEKKELKKINNENAKWYDEEMLDNAVYACTKIYGKDSDTASWLQSLKQRIEE